MSVVWASRRTRPRRHSSFTRQLLSVLAQRQSNHEARAAARWCFVPRFSALLAGHLPHDVQSESGSFAAASAREALEQAVHELVGNAWPMVRDADLGGVAGANGGEHDRDRAVTDRVLQVVADHLIEA